MNKEENTFSSKVVVHRHKNTGLSKQASNFICPNFLRRFDKKNLFSLPFQQASTVSIFNI